MRLHRLEITAFGPFADPVEVDFDALSEAGLFLLSGPTGAGKSSVLDAVCFALYGEVPGERSTARRLRCDVAAAGVAPRVFLDVSLGARRLQLTRSPAWRRPKKRGTGETTEQARVLVAEVLDGRPTHLTNRLDEAGHLLNELLGMNLAQFTQVAMLPQGRFQDFLRARSEDRHTLLQQLFSTRRFEDVERWLRDRRVELRRGSETHARSVAEVVARLREASGSTLVDEPEPGALDDGALQDWVADLLAEADTRAARAAGERRACAAAAQETERALVAGRELADLQRRHAEARALLVSLDAQADAVATRRRQLDDARRAVAVAALAPRLDRASTRCVAAGPDVPDESPSGLAARVEHARRALAAAEALLPRDRELADLRRAVADLGAEEDTLGRTVAERAAAVAELPGAVMGARADLRAAQDASARLEAQEQRVATLTARRDAARATVELAARLAEARARRDEAVEAHQGLRERWLDLRERRLSGMAAEIALGLAVGDSCPVCGSCDHPRRASTAAGASTAGDESAAQKAVETADVARSAHDEGVRALASRLDSARALAGGDDPDTLDARTLKAVDRLRETSRAATRRPAAEAAAGRLEDRAREAGEDLQRAQDDLLARRTRRLLTQERVEEAAHALAEALEGCPDAPALVARRRSDLRSAERRLAAAQERADARDALEDVRAEVEQAALSSNFHDAAEALAAVLDPATMRALERQLGEHDAARAGAEAHLDDPRLSAAAEASAPDLIGLARVQAAAAAAATAAHAEDARAGDRRRRLTELAETLTVSLAAWAPVRAAADDVAGLAAFAEGRAGDNRLQMRLSAYVLSWRLGQVVAAANVRLAGMTDQRYALEHTASRGAGESRGGLSLVIRDAWSGEARDPVTLSGGETFVVSLALALGLTDVVTGEAGGAEIGTLFVDEGFGSLDAETLDDVLDTLDELRDGGRVVGVVSHVSEMRDRIPTRLQVHKARRGSTVSLVRVET